MRKPFTGWHMTGILTGGFAVVFAVNILMASLALSSFSGVVVENSYVASQQFNDWLAAAEKENRLGWKAQIARGGDGHLQVAVADVPPGTAIEAELRHPLGKTDTLDWKLEPAAPGHFISRDPLPEGRWLVRVTLRHQGDELRIERPLG
ncbi:MAG: FixH family protein [Novosphingobium sp.]|nr:FixH family protein [Novosphingobium sp.]